MTNRILRKAYLQVIGCCFLLLPVTSAVHAQTNDALQVSGFARLVLGYLDESNATYLGYGDNASIGQQSLIGLHADYQISDKLSLIGQFVGHSGDERESEVEWLYLTYEPTRAIQIKLGKQRTPFFNYSDSIDVGFAYPWITLPQQVYSSVFFSTFDGVLANYQWSGKEFGFELEGYLGRFEDKIYSAGVGVDAKVNDLRGLIGKMSWDSWTLRASYHTTDTSIGLTELNEFSSILAQYGFSQSAQSLNPNGQVDFYQIAASYENLDYFFRAEAVKISSESSTITDFDGYFAAAGYNYSSFVSYVSFGKNESSYGTPINEIPIGFDPQLDTLAYGYQAIFNALPALSSRSLTVGTRWDLKTNLALKAEVTWTEAAAGNSANFLILDNAKFDRKAPLYQMAIEWVF